MKKRFALNVVATQKECTATIAICTYNRIGTLPRTLDSLEKLRGTHDFEVIVVNGPSTDGTSEFLRDRDDVRVFRNPELNLSISRNIAIANAKGRYISFIDDDAIPEADWLEIIINRFENDPNLAAVGGFIRDANGINFQAKHVYCDIYGSGIGCDNPDYMVFPSKTKKYYPSLTGTNVTFRMSDLLKVHGFDEVFAYFLDETDVNKRMDDLDMKVEVIPEAEIHHKYAPSHLRTANNVPKNALPISRSIAYFVMTHATPEVGWEPAISYLQDHYSKELNWKAETLAHGHINKTQFETLMQQTLSGMIEGIDHYFSPTPEAAQPVNRIAKHFVNTPAIIRKMRSPNAGLRLCLLSQDHAQNDFGGIGRWTNLVAKGLVERGNEVTVIGQLRDGSEIEFCDLNESGFWSHNIHHFGREEANEIDCLGLPPGMANISKRKLSEMRRIQPRRQFQVASSPIWDVEGAAFIGSGDIPTVLSLHTSAGIMLSSKPEWLENKDYYHNHVLKVIGAEIQAMKRSPMILANSKAIMADISEVYGLDLFKRPHVIVPHGIEDISSPDGLLEARIRKRKESATPIRILFLGRLETRKGVAHMAPTVARLLRDRKDVVVDIVGSRTDDKNFKHVSELIEEFPDQVQWHGFLDDTELDSLLRVTDIFFAPSLYESFGLIFAEAMRYSIPCVAYATGGVSEVIEHKKDGFTAKLGDQDGLYTALESLISNTKLRNSMSKQARRNFEAKFGYQLMAERLEEVYRSVALGEAVRKSNAV